MYKRLCSIFYLVTLSLKKNCDNSRRYKEILEGCKIKYFIHIMLYALVITYPSLKIKFTACYTTQILNSFLFSLTLLFSIVFILRRSIKYTIDMNSYILFNLAYYATICICAML